MTDVTSKGFPADVEIASNRLKSGSYKASSSQKLKGGSNEARGRALVFAGLFVMITASSSLYSLLAPFFPMQAEEKGVSTMLVSRPASMAPLPCIAGRSHCSLPSQTGVIFAVFALVVFITSPLFGVHMAAIGQRRLMFAGASQLLATWEWMRRRSNAGGLRLASSRRRTHLSVHFDNPFRVHALCQRRRPIHCLLFHASVLPGEKPLSMGRHQSFPARRQRLAPSPTMLIRCPRHSVRFLISCSQHRQKPGPTLAHRRYVSQGLGAAAVETSAYAITANLFPDAISYMMGLLEARATGARQNTSTRARDSAQTNSQPPCPLQVACGMGLMIGPPVGGILYGHDNLGRSMPFLVRGLPPYGLRRLLSSLVVTHHCAACAACVRPSSSPSVPDPPAAKIQVVGCLPLPCLVLFSVLLPPNLGLMQVRRHNASHFQTPHRSARLCKLAWWRLPPCMRPGRTDRSGERDSAARAH